MILGLKSCRGMMLVKIMDEVNEKSAEKDTDEENQKNIIEENVKRISGKKGDDLKQEILKLHPEVFTGLGRLELPYHMQLEQNSTPVIHVPRKIPVSLRNKLKKGLYGMEVIEKVVEPTEWVHSLVVVENPDGSLRLCLDPRDLSKVIKREHFQLPTFEDISTRLAGATHFTKLDAKKGYWQISLDEESAKLTTMNTPFGRYKFLRLPFGIHSAQEVFHGIINGSFIDIVGVETDIDDLLIWGENTEDHNKSHCIIGESKENQIDNELGQMQIQCR